MKLQILIVNFNLKDQTNILLNQLMQQNCKDFAITLIDQASTEKDTEVFLNNWSDKVTIIRNSENLPLNHVWNNSIKNSDADIITLLNNDVEVPNNYIKDTLEVFQVQHDIVCAFHATNNPKYSEIKNDLQYALKQRYDVKQGWEFTIRKEWFSKKPIPETLNLYFGDDFIFNRIYEENKRMAVITSSPIVHHCSLTEKKNVNIKTNNKLLFKQDRINFLKLGLKHFLRNDFEFSKLHKPQYMMLLEEQNKNKISCIMPVYLGEYPNCAKDREQKFIRAVDSFLNQTYKKSELIIVSDDCEIAERIYKEKYSDKSNIIFKRILGRNKVFSGNPRNEGIGLSAGEFITYLDSDDFILPDHLENIINGFNEELDWVYYNDNVITSIDSLYDISSAKFKTRNVVPKISSIGTSSVTHKKYVKLDWGDGYAHDWYAIQKCLNLRFKKISNSGYVVCHIPGKIDL